MISLNQEHLVIYIYNGNENKQAGFLRKDDVMSWREKQQKPKCFEIMHAYIISNNNQQTTNYLEWE